MRRRGNPGELIHEGARMTKKKDSRLKLPEDFLGTVKALLNTPPPPKKSKGKKAKKRKG